MSDRTPSPGNLAGANPPTLKVLCGLSARGAAAMPVPSTIHCAAEVYGEPTEGFFRVARFGIQGVLLERGEMRVLISLAELWAVAASVEPGLEPPAGAPATQPIPREGL